MTRKGAMRRSDILPEVLAGLNAGRLETVTLVEWLAIDMAALVRAIAPEVGLGDRADELGAAADALASEGVTRRIRGLGAALHAALREHPRHREIYEALATHPSDMVRAWAAFSVTADRGLTLEERLRLARRFAADRSMAVRECAWDSFREYLVDDLERSLRLLEPWVVDRDENVRRCAVEATRPRGVWTAHIEALKRDPEPGLRLLEHVRADPSRYVQRAVANWLNDASKSRADWVVSTTQRWLAESPTPETRWIVHHALRTVRKRGAVQPG